MYKKYRILAGLIGGLFISGLVVSVGLAEPNTDKKLTEVQKLSAELYKMKLQLTVKEQQLAGCTIEVLQGGPRAALEVEFLKQVGADPGEKWDWSAMAPKKP